MRKEGEERLTLEAGMSVAWGSGESQGRVRGEMVSGKRVLVGRFHIVIANSRKQQSMKWYLAVHLPDKVKCRRACETAQQRSARSVELQRLPARQAIRGMSISSVARLWKSSPRLPVPWRGVAWRGLANQFFPNSQLLMCSAQAQLGKTAANPSHLQS